LAKLQSLSYSKNFPNFEEVDGSLPPSQQPLAATVSESSDYSPNTHTALI
jgi:hypothetical protein